MQEYKNGSPMMFMLSLVIMGSVQSSNTLRIAILSMAGSEAGVFPL